MQGIPYKDYMMPYGRHSLYTELLAFILPGTDIEMIWQYFCFQKINDSNLRTVTIIFSDVPKLKVFAVTRLSLKGMYGKAHIKLGLLQMSCVVRKTVFGVSDQL